MEGINMAFEGKDLLDFSMIYKVWYTNSLPRGGLITLSIKIFPDSFLPKANTMDHNLTYNTSKLRLNRSLWRAAKGTFLEL